MTDQLVELLDDDEKVAAVLAHEVGHLRHRHGARHILQDSLVALGTMALLGDGSNVAQLATTLPTVMLHTTYSRDFEREADQYAFDILKRTGRSPKLFGDALARLEAEHHRGRGGTQDCKRDVDEGAEGKGQAGEEKPRRRSYDLGYLSTHPSTEERVKSAEEAAR
jgi:Zn-dependent protease with chaperone function